MSSNQIRAIEKFLEWLKNSPVNWTISSINNSPTLPRSFIHVKFYVDEIEMTISAIKENIWNM